MIEGQEGVTWPQWLALAQACERSGLEGLFRADHYSSFHGPPDAALDAWATLAALAAVTTRIRLGSLVSPVTFRHPSLLARMAVTVEQVSGGRVEVGLGAGWHEDEHVRAGFPFPPMSERLGLLAEQLEIVHRSWAAEPFDFVGERYVLRGANPLPKPTVKPNLIVGGAARRGTVVPAVRFADEYNTAFVSPDEAARRRAVVVEACRAAGRAPLTFSLMTRCVVGSDRGSLERRLDRIEALTGYNLRERLDVTIVGTVEEVAERIREYEAAGVERLMLQHLLHEDLESIELLGASVAPLVAARASGSAA